MLALAPLDLADTEFAALDLGDARREARAREVLRLMVQAPAAPFTVQQKGPAAKKACYRLLENKHVTHAALLAAHTAASVERCKGRARVLAVQDTTGVSLPGLDDAEGLGPITDGKGSRGYLVHTTLLLDGESHSPLGVANQIVWARSDVRRPRSETAEQRRKRDRESEHWWEAQVATARAFGRSFDERQGTWSAPAPDQPRVVVVGDRESDIYELLEEVDRLDHGFVLRACRDRRLTAAEEARAAGFGGPVPRERRGETTREIPRQYSMSVVAATEPLGIHFVTVPRRPGQVNRLAALTIRSRTMDIRPPKNRGRKGAPQTITYVDVREESPPVGADPLHWCLITDECAETLADCVRVVDTYRARWVIEEFHMGLKTGVGVERRQFETFDVHATYLAFASIVAWQILALRAEARSQQPRPADEILTPTQLTVLRGLVPGLPAAPDGRQALRAVALLGGFWGRKGDGEPGWRTIWWGFARLMGAEEGFNLALSGSGQR